MSDKSHGTSGPSRGEVAPPALDQCYALLENCPFRHQLHYDSAASFSASLDTRTFTILPAPSSRPLLEPSRSRRALVGFFIHRAISHAAPVTVARRAERHKLPSATDLVANAVWLAKSWFLL